MRHWLWNASKFYQDSSLLFLFQLSPWWCSAYNYYLSWWYCSQLIMQQTITVLATCWDLILKIKNCWKIFHRLLFDFEVPLIGTWSCLLKLKKLSFRINLRKVLLKIWISLQSMPGILIKMYYEIKLFQVYSLQSVPVLCIIKWWTHHKFKKFITKLKSFSNTFHPFCFFSHLQVHYFSLNKLFVMHFIVKNRWILSLAAPFLVFSFK